MAQTNQTINKLIENAYFLTGEISPEEDIPSRYMSEALDLLNDLINHFSTNAYNISYMQTIKWNTVPNQADYIFSNDLSADIISNRLTSIEFMNYQFSLDDGLLYPMAIVTRAMLFNNSLLEKSGSLPAYALLEREISQSRIKIYPTPSQVFFMTMRAKFYIDKFELNQNIINVPLSEQRFLKYALARELTFIYPATNWTPIKEDEYQTMKQDRFSTNDIDMMAESSTLLRAHDRYYNGLGLTILGG